MPQSGIAPIFRSSVQRIGKRLSTNVVSPCGGIADDREARAILDKAVAAVGGAAVLDRIATIAFIGRAAALTHGLDGRAEEVIVPDKSATLIELGAFGKTVLKLRVVVDQQRMLIVDRDGEQATETGKICRRPGSLRCRIPSSGGKSASRPSPRPARRASTARMRS